MTKKLFGILVIMLLITTTLPIGSAYTQSADENKNSINQPASPIVIKIRNGLGVTAIIKNIGTTDINKANISVILDGEKIFWGKEKIGGKMSIKAGSTYILKSFILGYGPTNITITVDTTAETVSAYVQLFLIYGVK